MDKLLRRTIIIAAVVAQFSLAADLSPENWPTGEYEAYLAAQSVNRVRAGHATGQSGAVAVAYNGLAARAGLEALRQGGNAMDSALTTAIMQIALTAGAPISYFGIMSLVYYDVETDRVYIMDAGWNTILAEDEPTTIPSVPFGNSVEAMRGTVPSGRTALVGGFIKGVESAHRRFGILSFRDLFGPALYVADSGMPVSPTLAEQLAFRDEELRRLPDTKAVFIKADGSSYKVGDIFKQPALAKTLRSIAENGADYMYVGPWAQKLIDAVQADGGKMTMQDLREYDVVWDQPLIGRFGEYELKTTPQPNLGGAAIIEAQNLARVSGLIDDGHWSVSGAALRKAVEVAQLVMVNFLSEDVRQKLYPGIDFSPDSRATREHAERLWALMEKGAEDPFLYFYRGPNHSDNVVAIDHEGNIAAITHTINCVLWGRTAIAIDGVSIGDPASFTYQQSLIAEVGPGNRLSPSTETGIVFKDDVPVLGFASMGSGSHQRTMQGLLNVTAFGMSVQEAIDSPDFFLPQLNSETQKLTVVVPKDRFSKQVLKATGYAYKEIDSAKARFSGEGVWTAVSRDSVSGRLDAASHNRTNSAAVAY